MIINRWIDFLCRHYRANFAENSKLLFTLSIFFYKSLQNYIILVKIFIVIEKYVIKLNILILMIIVSKIQFYINYSKSQ